MAPYQSILILGRHVPPMAVVLLLIGLDFAIKKEDFINKPPFKITKWKKKYAPLARKESLMTRAVRLLIAQAAAR